MTFNEELAYQEQVSELADSLVEAEIRKGTLFSEGLCSWAINQAKQSIPMKE